VGDDSDESDVGQRPRKKKRRTPTTNTRKGKRGPDALHEHITYLGAKLPNAYPLRIRNLLRMMIVIIMDDGRAKVDQNADGSISVTSHEQQKSASLPVVQARSQTIMRTSQIISVMKWAIMTIAPLSRLHTKPRWRALT